MEDGSEREREQRRMTEENKKEGKHEIRVGGKAPVTKRKLNESTMTVKGGGCFSDLLLK